MDWSPESVFDFGARTHRRGLRWRQKRQLLWPVWAWRVVAPNLVERKLNPLQRVVLRLCIAGCTDPAAAAALLHLEPELVAFVLGELTVMDLLDKSSVATERAARFLEETELDVTDLRVGWVFQDSHSGRLFPRFVDALPSATCEPDDEGRPLVTVGSKGKPFSGVAFLAPQGRAPTVAPTPRDILDAARRHRRHLRRHRRAGIDAGVDAPDALDQISLVSDRPERAHLLTFLYVPEEPDEEYPWYVADPFGFGASEELREAVEELRLSARGGFRDLLDGITGAALDQHRDHWAQMQNLLREEARRRVNEALPRGRFAADEPVRDALESAFLEMARLEQSEQAGRLSARDLDGAYLRLRQAVEAALVLLHARHPPRDAWQKVHGLPKDASRETIRQCAVQLGFRLGHVPQAVANAAAGQIQWVCTSEPAGRVRPTLAALLLHAVDMPAHPMREIAALQPRWLADVDHVAESAGGQVHAGKGRRDLASVTDDLNVCVSVVRTLLNALAPTKGLTPGPLSSTEVS